MLHKLDVIECRCQLNCCGVTGPLDYQYSVWFNHTKNSEGVFVPPSCCVLLNNDPQQIVIKDVHRCQLDAILYPINPITISYSLKSQVMQPAKSINNKPIIIIIIIIIIS